MEIWKYRDYVSPTGATPIAKWLSALTIPDRATIRALMRTMARQKVWAYSDFHPLKGQKYKGLGEFRWKSLQKTPLRLVGFKEDDRFVFLIGCSHKNNIYKPHDALGNR